MIDILLGRAVIGCWNLLICLHQSSPVRWLWHSEDQCYQSVLTISRTPANGNLKLINAINCSPFFPLGNTIMLPPLACLAVWWSKCYELFACPLKSWPHKCWILTGKIWSLQSSAEKETADSDVCGSHMAHKRHRMTSLLVCLVFCQQIEGL